jgi:predicted metal-dependent peptidase
MPSVEKLGCGRGILGVDSSGSVSTKEGQAYLGEMIGMIDDCRPDELTIVVCDTSIKSIEKWETGNDLTHIKFNGRGGTHCTPIFDYIEENRNDLDWCVYFTDLEINDFPKEENIPLLWLSTGRSEAPIGKVIKINADQ